MALRWAREGVCCVGLLALLAIVPTWAQEGGGEWEELFQRFETSAQPADFVVLVDTSGSMQGGKFAAARAALGALTEAVSPGDYLAVLGVDRVCRHLLPPHRISSEEEKRRLRDVLGALPEPSAEPQPGDWGATDLGLGVARLLDELMRPGASEVQFVFLLTDGFHQPPLGTSYPPRDAQAWHPLQAAAREALKTGGVEVNWLWFDAETSADYLGPVFPGATPLALDSGGMRSYFERLRDEVRVRKLRLQVAHELSGGRFDLDPPNLQIRVAYHGHARIPLRLRSRYGHLSAAVHAEGGALQATDRAVLSMEAGPSFAAVEPGQTVSLGTLTLQHRTGGLAHAILSSLGFISLPAINAQVDVPLQWALQPAATLRKLAPGAPVTGSVAPPLRVTAQVLPPVPVWQARLVLGLVLALGALGWLIRRGLLRPPRMRSIWPRVR